MDMWSTRLGNEAMDAIISMAHSIKDINNKLSKLTDEQQKDSAASKSYKQGVADGLNQGRETLYKALTFYLARDAAKTDSPKIFENVGAVAPILGTIEVICEKDIENILNDIKTEAIELKSSSKENPLIVKGAKDLGNKIASASEVYRECILEYNKGCE